MGLAQPVVLDATVLSNFASSSSVGWLTTLLERPVVVPAVRTEVTRGRGDGHEFLSEAIDGFGETIAVVEPDDEPIVSDGLAIPGQLDPGEAESLVWARDRRGTLATDDLAARSLAAEWDVPVTGSIGFLALGVQRGRLEVETANDWLATWREERGYYAPVERVEDVVPDR